MLGKWLGWGIGVAAALLPGLLPQCALAAASDWAVTGQGRLRLVAAADSVGDAGQAQLGLQFELNPGWKIYWRSPGDAGFPPSVDWKGSDNLVGAPALSWPAPHRFSVGGLETVGYKTEVILPIAAQLAQPGQPLRAHAAVDYLVCDQICIPQHADLALDLPSGPARPGPEAHDLARFIAAVPGDGSAHGLTLAESGVVGRGSDAVLRVVVTADPPLSEPDLFVEAAPPLSFQAPDVTLENGGRRAVIEARAVPGGPAEGFAGQPMTVTVADGARALEAAITPPAITAPAAGAGQAVTLLGMLGAALLGGLILNLMPCVLPVLSLKILGVIGHGGGERRHIRTSFIASAAGILTSFAVLAGLAVAVKAAGAAVGWGIQFQQPLFLVFLVVVVSLFAANLWGLFEIPMPSWLGGLGGGRAKSKKGHHGPTHSLSGHFATGAFATLLATPCTAPFLGTAVGFALARGPVEIFAVFIALGLGMALPYLAVAVWPGLAQRLPRPGKWMISLRRLLGLALALTAIWLLSVLAAVAGTGGALLAGAAMAAAMALLALRGKVGHPGRSAIPVAVAALAGLAFVAPFQATSTAAVSAAKYDGDWAEFDRKKIAALVAEGKTVFVDVTADWCVTCQVNKATVIYRGAVAERLKQPGMVPMRADWTRPDDRIAAYLNSFGRYGIPFNAVYGPNAPEGLPLPELLTEDVVLAAFARASGK